LYEVPLCAKLAGVQFVNEPVMVDVEEKPFTPSKTDAVVAGETATFPEPEHVPEIVNDFVYPLATNDL